MKDTRLGSLDFDEQLFARLQRWWPVASVVTIIDALAHNIDSKSLRRTATLVTASRIATFPEIDGSEGPVRDLLRALKRNDGRSPSCAHS